MATFEAAHLILDNSKELILNCLRTSFDDKEGQTLHNTAAIGQVCPHLVNDDHVWSRI